jgi:hypothetical protein
MRGRVLGHLGILTGLLAVILELNGQVIALSPTPGSGAASFYAAVLVWGIGLVFVLLELVALKSSN